MEAAQLPPLFYDHLRSLVADPPEGMWYTSTQSFGDRLEATALAVGRDRLLVVNGVQPMRRDGSSDGRPRLRAVGPWKLDQVTIPYLHGTVHVTRLEPGPLTVAGGTRPNIDRNGDLMRELSNLPAVVQDHLETYIPSLQRTRRWVRSLGPSTTKPERFWLYTTSHDRLAYVHSTRWRHCDPSGLESDPARQPWAVTTLTAMIGPARRDQITLDGRVRPSIATGKRALPR
jgi:hypothetical protein